jgi:aminopeptidase-like protein
MIKTSENIGETLYSWAKDLFPLCRSLTGPGVRDTLKYLKNIIPELQIHSVPSGTKAFDWVVPDEWTIRDAYIADQSGKRIIDFKSHNLHVMGYSSPVDEWMTLDELSPHLYSLPNQPDAIPYITSYYESRWGFCLTEKQRQTLSSGMYHVVIDSELKPGVLNYGEMVLKGEEESEILLSTYICHPSMANNELSGPVVTTALANWINSLKNRRYTYRIIFIPETIGSIVYLSKHYEAMKKNTKAGFVVTCVGDDNAYSFLPSRMGNTLSDRVAQQVLKYKVNDFSTYSYLDRGSDERQYCSPLIDLPIASVMRTKYGSYPEYHTSLDNLDFISPEGLQGAYAVIKECLAVLEVNYCYRVKVPCEPQLGKRGLYPTISTLDSSNQVRVMLDFLAYADGKLDLLQIAELINADILECAKIAQTLKEHDLVEAV